MSAGEPGAKSWRLRGSGRPEAAQEVAAVLRRLMVQPWLVGGQDDVHIATVRRHESAVRDVLGRLGWVLVVDRDFVRLRKSPPVRRAAWASGGPSPLTCSWFFLLVAAAESMPSRVAIGQLVVAARSAAAEAGIASVDDRPERHAILAAVRMLEQRGVVENLDGDLDDLLRDDSPPVLLAIHHRRLVHVVANFATADPVDDPAGWLAQVERESEAAVRMRRALVDDTVVYAVDLDSDEADWLSRRVRGDDGAPLAEAFGLHLERRAEGAAFVVPGEAFRSRDELGERAFPGSGTVPHAALLLCDAAESDGVVAADRPGWRALATAQIVQYLAVFADRYRDKGWSAEYAADTSALASAVDLLLTGANLLRIEADTWWFAPAAGRWQAPPEPAGPRPAADVSSTVE